MIATSTAAQRRTDEKTDWTGSLGFISVHIGGLLAFLSGFSPIALLSCIGLYAVRMFAITAGYHRYFSHRSFRTSRAFQFALAWLGSSSAQKGPLWWASQHRHHHRYSDMEEDIHSPIMKGVWWAHAGWILCRKYLRTRLEAVPDWVKFPELRWLEKWHLVPAVSTAVGLFGLGCLFHKFVPILHTNGWQMLGWGFFVSTVALYHGTFCINSLAHLIGKRRFATKDTSRNSFLLAMITLGEGWHNNHHRFPSSERQGYYWWEIDITHYALTVLSWFGLVWDLRRPPAELYLEAGR